MTNKIFIEIPTWLGDAVMTTPSIENLVALNPDCELVIFGSAVSTNLFKYHPNVKNIIIDNSKNGGNRYLNLYRLAKMVGKVDIAFSFRRNFTTKFLLYFIDATESFRYQRYGKKQKHQVIRYNDFINKSLFAKTTPDKLKIYLKKQKDKKKDKLTLGINPGATYGSAKRWYPQEFAKTAIELSHLYDIVIFGSPQELEMANDIETLLKKAKIKNYKNLAGQTTVQELISKISKLDLFITNDSGPMHLAGAFQVPTVAIFGPTKEKETHQWQNQYEMIVKKDFKCMPCMKRECPLQGEENHQCMKAITSTDVLSKIQAQILDKDKKKKELQKEFLEKYNLPSNTKLILFKANNFRQNGVVPFLNMISKIIYPYFRAIVCGDDESINYAKNETQELRLNNKVIYLNDISIKTADIFVLPTQNKRFAKNVLEAMSSKCVTFTTKTNEAGALLDVFASMYGQNDHNTAHKIDAILTDENELKAMQKHHKEMATKWLENN